MPLTPPPTANTQVKTTRWWARVCQKLDDLQNQKAEDILGPIDPRTERRNPTRKQQTEYTTWVHQKLDPLRAKAHREFNRVIQLVHKASGAQGEDKDDERFQVKLQGRKEEAWDPTIDLREAEISAGDDGADLGSRSLEK